jgi:protease IV
MMKVCCIVLGLALVTLLGGGSPLHAESHSIPSGSSGVTAEESSSTSNGQAATARKDASEGTAQGTKNGKVRLAHITIEGSLPESPGELSLFGDLGVDLRKNVARLDQAAGDDAIAGVVLDIKTSVSRGKVAELRAAIKRVQAAGKKVYVHLEAAEGSQYLLAASCDEVSMPESGMLLASGIRAEFSFYKDLMARFGVEADMLHCGDYKGAAEAYTRDSLSEPVRENMTELVDDLYDQMVTDIASDRHLPVEEVRAAIDRGLLLASQAKEAGLIDSICYPDEFRSRLAEEYRTENLVYVLNYAKRKIDTDFSGPMGMMKMFQAMFGGGKKSSSGSGTKLAIVYAVGPIMTGESTSSLLDGGTMGSTTIVEALQDAAKDDSIKAIVLRVDSPGGSALASDLIWRTIRTIDKPVVASMGDVAASGGYYISMGADKIFAEPATVTGSIGVVGGKIAMKGLFDKVGVSTETISRGKNSGIFSLMEKFSPGERQVVEEMMQDVYRQFTTKAAEGRNMTHEELLALAGGRVYTGRTAKRLKLVDEVGTLKDAVAAAKRLAGLDANEETEIVVLPKVENPLEALLGASSDAQKEARLQGFLWSSLTDLPPGVQQGVRQVLLLQRVLREPAATLMPYSLRIEY